MKLLRRTLIFALFFQHTVSTAQSKRIAHWYFGHEAGIDFSSGTATADISGKLTSIEGSATISDLSGNLLFYTDGVKVLNRNHAVMPNGNNLKGDVSAVQSSLIVPLPGNNSLYYLFTTFGYQSGNGLHYSIVDMGLDGGLGDVTASKNIPLFASGTEQLAGTMHCNGTDYWIVSRQAKDNALRFYAYKLTRIGLSSPVISEFQVPIAISNTVGTLTFSQDGSLLAESSKDSYLFNFDIQTGVLTLKNKIDHLPNEFLYSNAFSPDGKKFYLTSSVIGGFSYLSQFDLTASNIAASRVNLDSVDYRGGSPNGFGFFGQIRLAPDQKIYVSRWTQRGNRVHPNSFYTLDSIDVIDTPNQPGLTCQHQRNYLYLNHKPTMLGLPTFISNYTSPVAPVYTCTPPDFTVSGECTSQTIQVSFDQSAGFDSFKWDFGDPASGSDNESTDAATFHNYSQTGQYEVSLVLFHGYTSDTVKKMVKTGVVDVKLGNDTVICGNPGYTLNAVSTGNTSYLWQDGSTGATLPVSQTGLYWVEVNNALSGCIKRDSINVKFQSYPVVDLGNDIMACEGQVHTLSTNIPGADYTWINGQTSNSVSVMQTGEYWVDVSLHGCTKRDTVQVTFNPVPKIDLGNDTLLCYGQTLPLTVLNTASQIRWQDNSSTPTFLVNNAGLYYCTVTENGCFMRDSIQVDYDDKPAISFGQAYTFCEGQYIELKPVIANTKKVVYLWEDGSEKSSFTINAPGVYTLTASNFCGRDIDSAIVKKGMCELYVPSAFTPNGDGRNDIFRPVHGDHVVKFKMVIYNRWGQKVFESADIKNGWNGFLNGNLQPQGMYIWTIQYNSFLSTNQLLKGTVVLIR